MYRRYKNEKHVAEIRECSRTGHISGLMLTNRRRYLVYRSSIKLVTTHIAGILVLVLPREKYVRKQTSSVERHNIIEFSGASQLIPCWSIIELRIINVECYSGVNSKMSVQCTSKILPAQRHRSIRKILVVVNSTARSAK